MFTISYPSSFAQRLSAIHGDEGQHWLASLPQLVRDCERQWDIEVISIFSNLTFNFVAEAQRPTGEEVVLKLGFLGS